MTGSPWDGIALPEFPALDQDLETDVAVVGGGICGATCAYLLAKAGRRVALLEKGRIGSGETGYTTAFLTKELDLALPMLVRKHGEAKAKTIWLDGQAAIDEVTRIVKEEKIACELHLAPAAAHAADDRGAEALREETKLAKKLGFSADYADGRMTLQGEGKFNAIKFIRGLTDRITKSGGMIFERTRVVSIARGRAELSLVTKSGKTIRAKHLVIATHVPDRKLVMHDFRLKSYQTFAIETRLPIGVLEEGIHWDTLAPFHYWRVDRFDDHDRLILGGEDTTEKPDPKKAHAALLEFAKKLTGIQTLANKRVWGGRLYETSDSLPIVGEIPGQPGVYVATGFSGNGMTFGVWAAMKFGETLAP